MPSNGRPLEEEEEEEETKKKKTKLNSGTDVIFPTFIPLFNE
jgi:hypothetical protein